MEKKYSSAIKVYIDDSAITNARIKVIGIGGGGINSVNRMIEAGIEGVDFLVVDTDMTALRRSQAPLKIQVASDLIKRPELPGALHLTSEDLNKAFADLLADADLLLLVSGLGGATGTGGTPLIAYIASSLAVHTIAIVTKPFTFEGRERMQYAEVGLQALGEFVDTVITIPNDALLNSLEQGASLINAFRLADDLVRQGVQSITDLIIVPGLINLDLADIRSVTARMGMGVIGLGHATGEKRAREATLQSLSSPLLGGVPFKEAKAALIHISGGADITLFEVNEASSLIRDAANDQANIVLGAVVDDSIAGEFHVSVLWIGIDYVQDSLAETTLAALPLSDKSEADIFVVWDPDVIQRDDYVSLITALGDIVRSEGGIGVERLRQLNFQVRVGEGVFV